MKFRVAVLLLLYKCLVFAPNVIFATESAVSGLPCPLKTCTDVLKELKDLEIRLAQGETQIEEFKKEKQDLEIRLAKSETQIQEKQDKDFPKTRKGFLQYYHHFTLDLNTVYKRLRLSEGNKVITHTDTDQWYPDHPDRFDWPQVLCRESVSNRRSYWEIEWSGDVYISVSYKSISRKGLGDESGFGWNDQSWSLYGNSIWHNNIQTKVSGRFIISRTDVNGKSYYRVGVYVDHSAGILSFYSISGDTMILIYTVQTTFTQPLYPGFRAAFTGSSVKLI